MKMKTLISAAVLLLLTTTAQAAPVHFQFNQSILFTDIAGVTATDTVTIDLFMDNGGTSTVNQFWTAGGGHYVSGSLTLGSYSLDFGSLIAAANFVTDLSGTIVASQFIDAVAVDNVDNFGTGGLSAVFDLGVQTTIGSIALFSNTSDNPANWQIVPSSSIPSPAPLALIGLGLAAMAGIRRFRRPA